MQNNQQISIGTYQPDPIRALKLPRQLITNRKRSMKQRWISKSLRRPNLGAPWKKPDKLPNHLINNRLIATNNNFIFCNTVPGSQMEITNKNIFL